MASDSSTGKVASTVITAAVIVAALGYFVDIYDLLLFSIVRIKSLKSLGYDAADASKYGLLLINIQMIGLLVGGVFWGIWGDKRGRLSVLFGSIIIYSIANIANGFITSLTQYEILRFIAGFGLAGELGAGITLVTESLPKEKRGYGTMIVAAIGVSGAVFAGIISHVLDNWRYCYMLGGGLGLVLLILRIGVYESGLFKDMQEQNVERGNILTLFRSPGVFIKYFRCILIGLPTWFAIGILVTFSSDFAAPGLLNIQGKVVPGDGIMYSYAGITVGSLLCSWLSQYLKSRRQAIFWFLILTAIGFVMFFTAHDASAMYFYITMVITGVGTGFWGVVITNAAEQFGTNIRATVATTVPNLIRGSLPIISIAYTWLQGSYDKLISAEILGVFIILIPLIALYYTEETFTKDLNYLEEI